VIENQPEVTSEDALHDQAEAGRYWVERLAKPIIFGIIGWVMGQTDLRKMKNNQMDPDGQGMTKAGWVCSILGTLVNGAIILFCCGFLGFMIWGASANSPRTTRSYAPLTVPAKQPMDNGWNPNPPGGQK